MPESWANGQTISDLKELATVAHRLQCDSVRSLCNTAFVVQCAAAEHPGTSWRPADSTCLTAANATELYFFARRYSLQGVCALGCTCAQGQQPCRSALP